MNERPGSPDPIRLEQRDRLALVYRVGGTIFGFAVVAWSFAMSSWGPWTIALFVLVTAGGGVFYHLLTSVTRCPSCNTRMINFGIGDPEARRKPFRCSRCGTTAYLTEGFYWQTDFSG